MRTYLVKMPKFVQRISRYRTWAFSNSSNKVYLTFDDGPIPEVTPWVLSELKKYEAKATFFCIGANIENHPDIFRQILANGHAIGNHTQHHINGFKTNNSDYVENVQRANSAINQFSEPTQTSLRKLFRPPYGKLRSRQAQLLRKLGYKIVMWEVLSADFDQKVTKEKCFLNVIKNIRPGSIVVFHDSMKAKEKLQYVLPKALNFIEEKGWKCDLVS